MKTNNNLAKQIICVALVLSTFACSTIGILNFVAIKKANSPGLGIDTSGSETSPPLSTLLDDVKPHRFDTKYPEGMLEKYNTLYSLNDDVVGWLKIPNSSIDTVVTQSKDNKYYLKSDFYGNYTGYGNAYMDYRASSKNLVQNTSIYGHTTEGKEQVFYDLKKYKDLNFFIQNPVIEFDTLYANYKWKIFGVYLVTTSPNDDNGYVFYYIEPNINKTGFDGYLTQVTQRSLYTTGVDANSNDKLLTLSTCTYDFGSSVNTRLVVAARLLRENETEEIDSSKVKQNNDYRRPQLWYSKYGKKNPYANSKNWTSATYGGSN